jgi:hypothetical protein
MTAKRATLAFLRPKSLMLMRATPENLRIKAV